LEAPHWVNPEAEFRAPGRRELGLRIRYRQPLQEGALVLEEDGNWYLDFAVPQRGIAAGQFAAWHGGDSGDEVLGSAVISE